MITVKVSYCTETGVMVYGVCTAAGSENWRCEGKDRANLALAHYLAVAISLGRAVELLDLPWLDLRTRCLRLDVPLRVAPVDPDEARADSDEADWCEVHSDLGALVIASVAKQSPTRVGGRLRRLRAQTALAMTVGKDCPRRRVHSLVRAVLREDLGWWYNVYRERHT